MPISVLRACLSEQSRAETACVGASVNLSMESVIDLAEAFCDRLAQRAHAVSVYQMYGELAASVAVDLILTIIEGYRSFKAAPAASGDPSAPLPESAPPPLWVEILLGVPPAQLVPVIAVALRLLTQTCSELNEVGRPAEAGATAGDLLELEDRPDSSTEHIIPLRNAAFESTK